MGEIADSLINGDCCEQCGEFIGDGDGYPRRCSGCDGGSAFDKTSYKNEPVDTTEVEEVLRKNGYEVMEKRQINYATQLKLRDGKIVNCYYNGRLVVQGKPDDKLKKIIKGC